MAIIVVIKTNNDFKKEIFVTCSDTIYPRIDKEFSSAWLWFYTSRVWMSSRRCCGNVDHFGGTFIRYCGDDNNGPEGHPDYHQVGFWRTTSYWNTLLLILVSTVHTLSPNHDLRVILNGPASDKARSLTFNSWLDDHTSLNQIAQQLIN